MPPSDISTLSLGQRLYDAGWCQGALLPLDAVAQIRASTLPVRYQHAVVISQDCNIVRDDQETSVELAFGYSPTATENVNNLAKGRHPRQFLTTLASEQRFVWDVRERAAISKDRLSAVLGSAAPLGRMLDSDIREFRAWLGRRYSRPAFPDAFNDRIKAASAGIEKATKAQAFLSIRGIYYLITERDEELAADQPYHLRIAFCFEENGTPAPLPAASTEIARFITAVAQCQGIVLGPTVIVSNERFPVRWLDAWDCAYFDTRSFGCPGAAPPRV